jgi:predicted amidohydrolase
LNPDPVLRLQNMGRAMSQPIATWLGVLVAPSFSLLVALAAPFPGPDSSSGSRTDYVAAFIELHAGFDPAGPAATLALNARRSGEAAAAAAGQGAEIIVLPEYGMSGFGSGGRDAWLPYLEQLPPAGQGQTREVPCAHPDAYVAAPSLVTLSCAARQHGIVIVANIGDVVYCSAAPSRPGCASSPDGRLQFNTAVVLDSDGAYIAKAHKQNLWGEASYFDEPQDCPKVSFTPAALGVTFGLFTCADLIYEYPAQAMVDDGLEHFVVPIAWSDEMAQMQALPMLQAWSLAHCVNLVATNHRTRSMSGSGSFSCGHTEASVFSTGAASVASFLAAVLTEIYLCNVCSCQEILRRNGRGYRHDRWPNVRRDHATSAEAAAAAAAAGCSVGGGGHLGAEWRGR